MQNVVKKQKFCLSLMILDQCTVKIAIANVDQRDFSEKIMKNIKRFFTKIFFYSYVFRLMNVGMTFRGIAINFSLAYAK